MRLQFSINYAFSAAKVQYMTLSFVLFYLFQNQNHADPYRHSHKEENLKKGQWKLKRREITKTNSGNLLQEVG